MFWMGGFSMNSNVLKNEDITENIIAFKLTKSWKENMTKTELYDRTRGCWPVSLRRARCADYAFSVHEDTIIEVYKIDEWLPAEELKRETVPNNPNDRGRYGFEGEIAEPEIRDKYLGKSLENICKKGQYRFKYLPIHDKNNGKVIEEVKKIEEDVNSLNVEGASKKAIINARVNQGIFRELLLNKYNKCCLCDVKNPALLIASHIKPWVESEPEEKLDVYNGFLMCPNHDKLFDKGYITFDDDGKIKISEKLTEENEKLSLNVNGQMRIKLNESNKKYLKFHRENVFIDK